MKKLLALLACAIICSMLLIKYSFFYTEENNNGDFPNDKITYLI